MANRSSFDGRSVVITGGASGIGAALGAELVRVGAHVTLADIDHRVTATAHRAAAGGPGTARAVHLDVRDAGTVQAVVEDVIERHSALDYLFNNAGIGLGGPTHELTVEHWDQVLDVNLRGVINGILAAYPRMVDQGRGHIVNTASAAGLVAPPFVVPYATSKHAVVGLSTGLRPEAAIYGVRVSVLCPAAVETPILDELPGADLPATASAPVAARTYLAAVRQRPIPADRFARAALRGVAADEAIIVVPRSAKALWMLHRASPRLVQRINRFLARRVQRDLIRPRDIGTEG
jgi:NAD(P)-dependent dehydrogenase (short-subunit alcohol dehydrogenase family)